MRGDCLQNQINRVIIGTFGQIYLDRRIRNASSHLDFYYDEKSQIFRGKDIVKVKYKGKTRKKVNRFSISPEEFLYETLPNAVNASQSFWAAGILLCLEPYPEYYNKALAMLNEDNQRE